MRVLRNAYLLAFGLLVGWGSSTWASEPVEVAAKVDTLLREEVPYAKERRRSPERVGDEIFLRRVSLDIVGRAPTVAQINSFVRDTAADKRQKVVERLLAESQYGDNWGRYWRDVIMYRKTEERGQLFTEPLTEYLIGSLNENKPWGQIATEFITAVGDISENGAGGLIMAQQGQPEEVTAEVSRIFLGVQIQCAQCHNHPTDRWTRDQFHQLAAFFPRVSSRIVLMPERREATVLVTDASIGRMGKRGQMNKRVRGTPEHYMTDPANPQDRGKLMSPELFATGQKLPLGTRDAERRGTLAKWITAPDNPYFARALVNRIWSELCGEGFCEPVDDMGPDRELTAPRTLEFLAKEFTGSGYDVKWLFRTITATEMYQLPSRERRGPEESPFQHNVAQRLRADQLVENLLASLDIPEAAAMGRRGKAGGKAGGPGGPPFVRGPRQQFSTIFGYDPSERRDEISSSIPQALMLMNSPVVNQATCANGRSLLARLLPQVRDDRELVRELYLRTLSRPPQATELNTCLGYVRQVGNRNEAFEDILWSLVNSTEFLHRS